MHFLHRVKMISRLKGRLFPFAVLMASALLPDGYADESTTNESPTEARSMESRSAGVKARIDALTDLKRKLSEAKTSEEKRALIEDFRAQNEVLWNQQESSLAKQQSPEVRLAELKAKAQGNPEMLARLDAMESRLASVETIKTKLAEAQTASGEQKVRLLEDIRREQTKLVQVEQQATQSRRAEANVRTVESTQTLPPEMAAMKAKSEARRQEVDQLREALTKASPQERQKLLDAWREKRMQETSVRTIPSAQ